jgi:hypothetical protein
MNLTLSIEDDIVAGARARAEALGTSVDQLVSDYLAQLVGGKDVEAELQELAALCTTAGGRSRGWKSNRAEIYDRQVDFRLKRNRGDSSVVSSNREF